MIYIALLKGINVGGHKKIKMTSLVEMLTTLDFNNVNTYIQSGNIVFEYKKTDSVKLATIISQKIKEAFGFDVDVIVKTKNELDFIFNNNPFIKNEINNLYISFLSSSPQEENIDLGNYDDAEYKVVNDVVYMYFYTKISASKLATNVNERKLKVDIVTTRNWKTTTQLVQLANDLK